MTVCLSAEINIKGQEFDTVELQVSCRPEGVVL